MDFRERYKDLIKAPSRELFWELIATSAPMGTLFFYGYRNSLHEFLDKSREEKDMDEWIRVEVEWLKNWIAHLDQEAFAAALIDFSFHPPDAEEETKWVNPGNSYYDSWLGQVWKAFSDIDPTNAYLALKKGLDSEAPEDPKGLMNFIEDLHLPELEQICKSIWAEKGWRNEANTEIADILNDERNRLHISWYEIRKILPENHPEQIFCDFLEAFMKKWPDNRPVG